LALFAPRKMVEDPFKGRKTASKWSAHLEKLSRWKVVLQCSVRRIAAMPSTYFAVFKGSCDVCQALGLACTGTQSCELRARTIFNGKLLSQSGQPPLPCGLRDLAELCITLAKFFRGSSALYGTVGDFRHFFHQFGLSEDISLHFVLRVGEAFFRWALLPMGWSWSPVIAQSATITMLLIALETAKFDTTAYKAAGAVPCFLMVTHLTNPAVRCFATAWYDNVFCLVNDHDIAGKVHRAIRETVKGFQSDGGKTIWKDLMRFRLDENGVTPYNDEVIGKVVKSYLGLEFRFRSHESSTLPKRPRTDGPEALRSGTEGYLEWRPSSDHLTKLSNLKALLELTTLTARQIARIAGTIIWHKHVTLKPLFEVATVIHVISTVSKTKKHWNEKFTMTSAWREVLLDGLESVNLREWIHPPVPTRIERFIRSATDASKLRLGWAWWPPSPDDIPRMKLRSRRWATFPGMEDANIFLKELLAAVLFIEFICVEYQGVCIVLAMDNSAAAAVLRRMYSRTQYGLELAIRAQMALDTAHNSLQIMLVTSEQNACADRPSRNRTPTDLEERLFLSQIDSWIAHSFAPSSNRKPYSGNADVRHSECDVDYDSGSEHDDLESEVCEQEEELPLGELAEALEGEEEEDE
jgi:hypothetical protein